MGSLKFAGTTADYARGAAPAVTSPPMTIAVLVRPRIAPAGTVCIGGMMDASAFNDAYLLRFTATPQFRLTVRDSSDLHINSTSTVTAGEWGWGVARITSTSSAESIWQGDFANKGSSATAKTVTGANIDRLSWGKRDSSANDQPFDGMINAAVVWNVALTDDEITALNQGIHPAMIRPAAIVHLLDRMGQTGAVRDIVGDNNLTVVGATVDDETPKRLPVTVSVGGSPFAVTQRLLRMRVSNADVWSTAAELAFPNRPFTFSGIHDATANEITLTLDDGTTQTISLAGSNDQDGDLVIGAGLDAGAVVDETTNELGVSAVTVSTKVPTSEDDERAQTQHAEWLAPSVTNTSASLNPAASVDVDLSSSVDDKGQGWSVVAVSSATGLVTPSILSGTTVRITSQASGSPSGSDTVTCSIRNNNPRPMTRLLDIAVTVGVGTFTNGYSYEKTLLASRQDVVSGTLSGVVVRLAMTDAVLADTGNGGNVESSDGYDIRFELEDQTKLSHHVRSYDNTTGALDVNIRIPTWSPSSESVPIRMFYGNASVTSAEQSVAGVWGDFLAVWDCRTGEDFSGNGRNLTPSNITAGTLLGDAGDYNGSTSVGVLTDPSWLSGLAAITISGWIKADSSAIGTDKGIISQGIISGPDDNMGIDVRFDGTTFNASPAQTNTFTLQFQTQGGGRPRAEFFSGLQTTDEQYFAAQFEIADIPKLFLDGEFKTPAFATTDVDSLPLQVPEGSLYLGAGPKDSASGGWAGLIDEIRVAGDAMPPAWLSVEYLTELRRTTWYGVSSENTSGASRYPVAATVYGVTGEAEPLTIGVVARSFDPAGGELSISALGAPSNGAVAEVSAATFDAEFLPYQGQYEGQIWTLNTQQINNRINDTGYYGWYYQVKRTGQIKFVQHQIASNKTGETSKSTLGGSTNHGYPASWDLRFNVFGATSGRQISGGSLFQRDFVYTNPDGDESNSRVVFQHEVNLNVTEGDRLLFLMSSRESNPADNCPSINMPANQIARPALGLSPERAVTLYHGDSPIMVSSSTPGGTLSVGSKGRLYSLGIEYSDGWQDGGVANDGNSSQNAYVYGTRRVRQKFTSDYWRKASGIALAVYAEGANAPQGDLLVTLSGADILTTSITIPKATISLPDNGDNLTHEIYQFATAVTLSPGIEYTIEFSSESTLSGRRIVFEGQRKFSNSMETAIVSSDPPATPATGIVPGQWTTKAEFSTTAGSSWGFVGYSSSTPDVDLPVALVLDAIGETQSQITGEVGPTGGGGYIQYTPADSFVGDDSFSYTLTNGDKTDTGTVYVSVTGVGGGTGFETPTGLWNAEAYSDLPAQFQDAVMIYANDTGGATQARLDFLNNTTDSAGPGPWGEGAPVYKYRRLEMRDDASSRAARDGRPAVRHKVRMVNAFGVPDTVHDLKLMMPQRSGFLQASENSPIQIDFGEFNCIILRWHMWADAWRANQDGGKRVQMLVGLGNRGAGNKPLTATETFGSTKGIGFNTQAPYISGDRMGLGSLVNHETNPNNSTWLGFGETENTNKRAHALNRWIAIDQIFRRNDAGQANGFWRVHTENSHFDVVRNNVKFCDNPAAQLKSISFELRMMHGGNPVKNEPGNYNKPVNDYNEDLGGFFLFKGNWVG